MAFRFRTLFGIRQLLVGALAASGLAVLGPLSPAQAESGPQCADVASNMDAARTMAAACNRRVESLADRTEYAQMFAMADGKGEWVSSPAPQRVRRANGLWADIDLTLSAAVAGGVLKPQASLADVRFSPGGVLPMVTWVEAGEQFTMSWPGTLPTPRIDGASAIYPNVFPDVDLHVTATLAGFTHVLEVKTPAAAANPAVRSVRFATGGNLKVAETADGLELRDPSGNAVAFSQGAAMWDSGVGAPADMLSAHGLLAADGDTAPEGGDPASAQSAGDLSQTAPVTVDADASGLTVTADASLLANGTFPIFIDPPFSKPSVHWAYATSNGENNNSDHARVGKMPDNAQARYRSYWSFPTTGLPGTQILSAKVTAKLYHSSSCTATPVYAYSTSNLTAAHQQRMAWGDRPLPNGNYAGSWSGSANKGSCPQVDADAVFDDAQMRTELQATATSGWSSFIIGLCTCDTAGNGESDSARWKKFYVEQTFLIAQFDLPPYKPVGKPFPLATDCYKLCGPAATAVVRTTTPTLTMSAQDPYGGSLTTCFEVRTAASDTATIVVADGSARHAVSTPQVQVKDTSPAAETKYKIPSGKLANGSTYYWRATTYDENSFWSGWSPWYSFTVDGTDPGTPSVSSSAYPSRQWSGGVDVAGSFTFTGDSQAYEFTWWVDGGTQYTAPASGTTSKTATISYTPSTGMAHIMHVNAKDAAGRVSGQVDCEFWVTTTNKYSHWALDETVDKTVAPDSGTGILAPGTLGGTAKFASGSAHVGTGGVSFTSPGGEVKSSYQVLDTAKSFTVMAWVRITDVTSSRTVLSQAGANASGFQLEYRTDANAGTGGFCFTMLASDAAGAAVTSACAITVDLGDWVHLAGVFDRANNKIHVFVLGDPQCNGVTKDAAFTTPWAAAGKFVIGRASGVNDVPVASWIGDVDDVWAHQRVLNADEICIQALK